MYVYLGKVLVGSKILPPTNQGEAIVLRVAPFSSSPRSISSPQKARTLQALDHLGRYLDDLTHSVLFTSVASGHI